MLWRKDDGSAEYCDVIFDRDKTYREYNCFDCTNAPVSTLEEAYQVFGTCDALTVSPEVAQCLEDSYGELYQFLFGRPINDLLEYDRNDPFSFPKRRIEWTKEKVASMDWNLFCLSYYTFLRSNNTFLSGIWEALREILSFLKTDDGLLHSVLCDNAKNESVDTAEFWNTIGGGLEKKILSQHDESRCRLSFIALQSVKEIMDPARYQQLVNECSLLFDKLARERIDKALKRTYSVRELIEFDIETLFFYEEYFSLAPDKIETKRYVYDSAFRMLTKLADMVRDNGKYTDADKIYEAALRYALTNAEIRQIEDRRKEIAPLVDAEKEKKTLRQAKTQEKARIRSTLDSLIPFFAITLLISALATVTFGVLTLFGVGGFCKTALIVSAIAFAAVVVIIAVISLIQKISRRR